MAAELTADGFETRLGIALVAHDRLKPELAAWAAENADKLSQHRLFATGTTGRVLCEAAPRLRISALESGPLGGDLQIGSKLVEGEIDLLIFFVDPLTPQPHDVDVKALIRIATLYGAPLACNRATADALLTAPWFAEPELLQRRPSPLADAYRQRAVAGGPS